MWERELPFSTMNLCKCTVSWSRHWSSTRVWSLHLTILTITIRSFRVCAVVWCVDVQTYGDVIRLTRLIVSMSSHTQTNPPRSSSSMIQLISSANSRHNPRWDLHSASTTNTTTEKYTMGAFHSQILRCQSNKSESNSWPCAWSNVFIGDGRWNVAQWSAVSIANHSKVNGCSH